MKVLTGLPSLWSPHEDGAISRKHSFQIRKVYLKKAPREAQKILHLAMGIIRPRRGRIYDSDTIGHIFMFI